LTRLLAEQGILGLVYFLLLLFIGWKAWGSRRRIQMGNVLFILFLIGLMTSFHSAMRTFVTPFLIALSAMGMTVDRNPKPR
jgi:O-antigen ligase